MSVIDIVGIAFLALGTVFFAVGSLGLVRLPDVYTRLHALTKADNLGLGFVIIGLSVWAESWVVVAKMALIWGLVIVAGATACYLVAESARLSRVVPWRKSS